MTSPTDATVPTLAHAVNRPGGKDPGASLTTEYVALSMASKLAEACRQVHKICQVGVMFSFTSVTISASIHIATHLNSQSLALGQTQPRQSAWQGSQEEPDDKTSSFFGAIGFFLFLLQNLAEF